MPKTDRYVFAEKAYGDVRPVSLERVTLKDAEIYRFARTDSCALYFVYEGECDIVRGGRKIAAVPGTLAFEGRDDGLQFSLATEKTAVIFRLSFRCSNAELLRAYPEETRYGADTFHALWELLTRTSLPEEAAISKIFEVAYTLKRISLIKKSEKNYVARACAYIDDNYASKLSVSDIAESLSINRQYLTRLFRQKKGVSVQQYIINTRLGKAREILDAGYSVSETAAMVGYGDQFGFTRIFSKTYGMSPTKYKSRNREE